VEIENWEFSLESWEPNLAFSGRGIFFGFLANLNMQNVAWIDFRFCLQKVALISVGADAVGWENCNGNGKWEVATG